MNSFQGGSHVPKVKIAAVQMLSVPRVGENLAAAEKLIAKAAQQDASLVVLPEYFSIMSRQESERIKVAEDDGQGPIQDFLVEMAKKHRLWLIGGSIPLHSNNPTKTYNSSLVYNPEGERVARYDKIHLFGFTKGKEHYNESKTIEPGAHPVVVSTPFAKIGLSVCYDLRFPELYRSFGAVDLIVVPSAFTETTGQVHWEILLRARAIENLCYVLAPAQGGKHENGRETYGNSILIDPWGAVMHRLDKGEGVLVGELDHEKINKVRKSLPALDHRILP